MQKAELTTLLIPVTLCCFCQTPNENILHAALEHSLKFDPLDLVQYNPAALWRITVRPMHLDLLSILGSVIPLGNELVN